MTFIALIVLRNKQTDQPDAFRVPLFPGPPIFMTIVSLGIVYSSIRYIISQEYYVSATVVTSIMVAGALVSIFVKPAK